MDAREVFSATSDETRKSATLALPVRSEPDSIVFISTRPPGMTSAPVVTGRKSPMSGFVSLKLHVNRGEGESRSQCGTP